MMEIMKRMPVRVNPIHAISEELRFSLSGEWFFRLDPKNVGIAQKWYTCASSFMQKIHVPGCWQGQGFGTSATERHKEFGVEIRAFQATYEGVGWYARTFDVPCELKTKRIWLFFGGVNPTATIYLNGILIADHHEPFVPFGLDVTDVVHDKDNLLVVRISEEDRVMGLTYHYCGKWSGLYRDVELVGTGERYVQDFQIIPDASNGNMQVLIRMGGSGNSKVKIDIMELDGIRIAQREFESFDDIIQTELHIDNHQLWSPEHPVLYGVCLHISCDDVYQDSLYERFGFISLETEEHQLMINWQPYYLRGTGDFGEMPETGSPTTSREYWKKRLTVLKNYGYHYVRCQSYAPVPEYLDAADEVGLLVQSEMGVLGPIGGMSQDHTYNQWPKPTPDFRDLLFSQWKHVVWRDVNHVAANMYAMSNEVGQGNCIYYPGLAWKCYNETKKIKSTAFVIWTDGGYNLNMPGEFASDEAEKSIDSPIPVIQHEYMWWSSYPDISLAPLYKGAMRPFAEEIALQSATDHGLAHILPLAAKNSQILQFIEAKGKMEKLRRDFPKLAGVCHFNAMDTGMSKQGIVNMFYERKYATADEWKRINNDAVILSSLDFDNRVYIQGDEISIDLFISDYAHPHFSEPVLNWGIKTEAGTMISSGSYHPRHTPYTTYHATTLNFETNRSEHPTVLTVDVNLEDHKNNSVYNQWKLWCFPKISGLRRGVHNTLKEDTKVLITQNLDDAAVQFMANGGVILLKAGLCLVRPFCPILRLNTGRYFFTRPANFPPFEELQNGTIIQSHPILGDFPADNYADLQFYRLIAEMPAIDLEPLGLADEDPIIRMIHSYYVNRSLGYIVERQYGAGRLVLTSMDIFSDNPEAQYLLDQICAYELSGNKAPCTALSEFSLLQIMKATEIDYEGVQT